MRMHVDMRGMSGERNGILCSLQIPVDGEMSTLLHAIDFASDAEDLV